MNKDIIEDEVEFPDEIVSFLKVKYPKAHTDQEKAVLKQIEQLNEEKKELKDIISRKREQAKLKSLPISVIPSEEAKEKAIKLVQDGSLLLSSKSKSTDREDSPLLGQNSSSFSQNTKFRSDDKKSENSNATKNFPASKISFVSGGYAFGEISNNSTEETQENLKRIPSLDLSNNELLSKKPRLVTDDSSESEEQDKSNNDKVNENRSNNSSVLRFCGHNMNEEFVKRIVEEYGTVISLNVEERHDNSSVVVTLENSEIARIAKEALDSQYIEGRVVNVYYKRGSSEFGQRRPFRRRRSRDFARGRGRYQRQDSFQIMDSDKVLPSHFYNAGGENDDNNISRKPRWNIQENESNEQPSNRSDILPSGLKINSERGMVQYNDLEQD